MIRRNILANIVGRAWGFVSIYLFVPLYLQFLGVEAYGLVGFYSVLLGVLTFADMGFTATLNREMARLSVGDDTAGEMKDVLRTYENTYLLVSVLISILIWFLAPAIAEHWLNSKTLSRQDITSVVQIMGVAIALQLPSGLYIGGLMGLQQQVRSNILQITWGVVRGLGGVLVLWLYSPTIYAFALWQMTANAVYYLCARNILWRTLSCRSSLESPKFRWEIFRNTSRYAFGMAGMAVLSVILTQADKLAVSKMMTLEYLGYYTIAGSLAVVPLMIASPIAAAVFPRLTGLVALGDYTTLNQLYQKTYQFVSIAIIPAGLTIILFSRELIYIWTGSMSIADQTWLVASLLVGGQLLQAITVVPYYLALAHGAIRLNLVIGVISVALIAPLLIYSIKKIGMEGAGLSWLIVNGCTVLPYMYVLHRNFMPGRFFRWLLYGIALPILVALPCVLAGRWLLPATLPRIWILPLIGTVWIVAVTAAILFMPELRRNIAISMQRFKFNLNKKWGA